MKTKNIILGAVLAVMGLIMLITPGFCMKAFVILVGLAAVASGIYNLCVVYKTLENPVVKKSFLIKSIASIGIGLIAVVCPIALLKTAETVWAVFSFILAAYLLLYAIFGFVTVSKMKDSPAEEKKRYTNESLICLLMAVLLFIVPIKSLGILFVRVLGAGALIIGAVLIVVEILVSKRTIVVDDAVVVDDVEADKADAEKTEAAEKDSAADTTGSEK